MHNVFNNGISFFFDSQKNVVPILEKILRTPLSRFILKFLQNSIDK